MSEELENKGVETTDVQQEQISEIIEDFIPQDAKPMEDAPAESTTTETEGAATTTTEEATEDVKEGEERKAEEASEQEQTDANTDEKKEGLEEKPVIEEKKPAETTLSPEDILKKENEELKAQLSEIAGRFMNPPVKQKTQEEVKAEQERNAKQVLKFLKDDATFDEVMKSSDNFNALMTSVVNTAVERSLRLMPTIATQLVDQQMTLSTAVNAFYTDNKDLEQHRKYVGFVANEVTAQHPDWGLKEVLQETEKEVRSRLKLERVANTIAQPGANLGQRGSQQIGIPSRTAPANPGFVPSGGGGRKGSSSADGNLSRQEKDILNLIS